MEQLAGNAKKKKILRLVFTILVSVFLILTGCGGSGGGGSEDGNDSSGNDYDEQVFQVNTYTEVDQNYPVVAGLSDGSFVVIWQSGNVDEGGGQDGSGTGIFGRLYDDTGKPVTEEAFQVNSTFLDNQRDPSVTSLPGGGFVVTWTDSGRNDGDIYGQRYDSQGYTKGNEFRANTTTDGTQYLSSAAPLPGDGFVVAWQSTTDSNIYIQCFDESGARIDGEIQVDRDDYGADWMYPAVASLSSQDEGDFVVTWSAEKIYDGIYTGDEEITTDIYGKRFDLAEDSILAVDADVFQVNATNDGNQEKPSLAPLSLGGFAITWHVEGSESYNVYGQLFNEFGQPDDGAGEEFLVTDDLIWNYYGQDAASLESGGFVVSWTGSGDNGSNIYKKRYDYMGQAVEDGFEIKAEGSQSGPAVDGLATNGCVVVWHDVDGNIYGRLF